ncbi:DUF2142 domain-containing protein [Lactococcus lactis]|jgi:uncharacterized membrane protein|uniref:DUF2142 domain-containing protein n=1 Tax=Lactococcus lactis TaxID=1358 RepID=UPI00206BA82D|nr:DUF2142 domain-containing protein [Lactococcus lactis]WKF73368.1 DUF2142 domain-containing protein [Lactococcus lactis]BDH80528.1 membrane protein [Lactococcus lactis]
MDTVRYRRNDHYQNKQVSKRPRLLFNEETIGKKIHKFYLTIALFFGVILSIGMPFFNEPDGVYHFVNSSNIVHLTTDITVYGENSKWFGNQFINQKPAYQNGDYFKKYFETEVQRMPMSKLPRSTEYPKVLSYNFLGHIVPAAGVWLGYHIYPSMGMMIVCARLLSMFVYSLILFFIIKYVKRGKLVFTIIGLSPVAMNTFSSLSYDGLTLILAAFLVAVGINMVNKRKITPLNLIPMIFSSIAVYFAAKTNIKLLILIFPIIVLSILMKGRIKDRINKLPSRLKLIISIFLLSVVLIGGAIYAQRYGGLGLVIYKLFMNFSYNFNPNINVQDINTVLVQPLATHNMMPFWLTSVWFIMILAAAFAEAKFVKDPLISYGALGLFILNILALYVNFFTGYSSGVNAANGAIGGVQGRYITPMFFLLPLFAGNEHFELKVVSYKTIALFSGVIIVISNSLLLFDTLFTILKF